jgi:sortase A
MMISTTGQTRISRRRHTFLRFTQRFFVIAGTLALSYVAVTLLYARIYQKVANNTLEQQMHAQELHTVSLPRSAVKEGDLLGRIEIPRLKVKVAIFEGTSSQTLRLGVGHIGGTALPGEPGNIGIAGHRDTYFRALKDIRPDDEIQIQTATGVARYAVDWIQITAPGDSDILPHKSGSALTLVTCYPFYFVGSAPERYVVHAHTK